MIELEYHKREMYPAEKAFIDRHLKDNDGCTPGCGLGCLGVLALFSWMVSALWFRDLGLSLLAVGAPVVIGSWFYSRQKARRFVTDKAKFLVDGLVEVLHIEATRIAHAYSNGLEVVFWIVELTSGEVLFVLEGESGRTPPTLLNGDFEFPCLKFDLYARGSVKMMGTLFCPLSEGTEIIEIQPWQIDGFIDEAGVPSHLEISSTSFDDLMAILHAQALDEPVDDAQGDQSNDAEGTVN